MAKKKDDKKPKKEMYVTPIGVAFYPYLDKPDDYKGKKNYRVKLRLSAATAAPIVAKVDELMAEISQSEEVLEAKAAIEQQRKEEAKKPKAKQKIIGDLPEHTPYEAAKDDQGEETGEIVFSFAAAAEGTYKHGAKKGQKWTRTIPMFDTKRRPVKKQVWSGSKLRVSYTIGTYFINETVGYGVKLYLEGVQIIDLVQGGQRSAEGLGFGEEEGFEDDGVETSTDTSTETGEGAEEGAADDGSEATNF